jgi:hypothetical protein
MDATKGKMAAMTMVRGDHFFLGRWLDYYGRQLGRENLYVLNHGGDPEIARLAEGANVVALPYDPTRFCFNQRRWQMLSLFTSAFTNFYTWILCGDVDEIVAVDPDVADSLPDYLSRFPEDRVPRVISPFAIEIVHNPALEPEPITEGRNILDVRRTYRTNFNYCKPCITRRRTTFSPGGHYATDRDGYLDPHLYLFHLRFVDYQMTHDRLAIRRAQRTQQSGALDAVERKATGWDTAWSTYALLSKKAPKAETVDHPAMREAMVKGRALRKDGVFWAFGGVRDTATYRLPPRFASLF